METTQFVRKPFLIEAIEITEDNIEELAEQIGEFCRKEDGTPFIKADKRLVLNSYRVYPGFFLTKMGPKTRCYSPRIFNDQFVPSSPDIMVWVDFMNASDEPEIVVEESEKDDTYSGVAEAPDYTRLADAGL